MTPRQLKRNRLYNTMHAIGWIIAISSYALLLRLAHLRTATGIRNYTYSALGAES